jgi:hypothetical protein
VRLDAPVLADPEEDDAIDGHLHRCIELVDVEPGVEQGELGRGA